MSHLARDVTVLAVILLVTHALSVLVVRHRQGFTMKDLHPPWCLLRPPFSPWGHCVC